ncbi:MAG: sulfatase-like hydrolase/transferase [Akkermansiaceae bacterium]|nr:sulfatase-like hydrolase/transferase [Akkermansiaceae bacterium]
MLNLRSWISPLLLAGISIGLCQAEPTATRERPNIIVILCDDLGYGDLSCYGHQVIETPILDKLAQGGIRFTDGYTAAPVCSPSRAGMLTGRNPYRSGIYEWIAGGPVHLRRSEVTFPELLKRGGYQTMLAGKWHLNGHFNQPDKQPTPGDHGFDYWFATHNNASPSHHNPSNFVRNGKAVGKLEGYSSSIVVRETLGWLDGREQKESPFLSVLTFHEPHTPVASPPELVERYQAHEKIPGQAIYWANVAQVDRAVGELLEGLKKRGLYQNTLIVFTSDNGPEEWLRYPGCRLQHGSVGPLRGHKLDVFEGGIRVPMIVSWPAAIAQGRVSGVPVSSLDLLPTFCALAGVPVPDDLQLDGCDISIYIAEDAKPDRRQPLFWFYQSARGYANFAMRDGDYTLIARRTGELFYPGMQVSNERCLQEIMSCEPRAHELYKISQDLLEVHDLKNDEPDAFKRMQSDMNRVWADIKKDCVDWDKE